MVEILGYVASIAIVVSLSMSSVVRLRMIGLVGSCLFLVYALAVEAYPVAATNVVIIGLHAFYLWRAYTDEEYFSLLEVQPDSRYLRGFIEFHRDEISRFQPEFDFSVEPDDLVVFVLRDMVPAGVVVGRRHGDELAVELDYVAPRYRDLEPARFLYDSHPELLRAYGIRRVTATASTPQHRKYLRTVGFTENGERFALDLEP